MKKLIVALALVASFTAQAEDFAKLETNAMAAVIAMQEQMFAATANVPELKGVSADDRRVMATVAANDAAAKADQNIAAELAQGHTCDEMLAGLKEKDRAYIQQNPQKTGFVIAGEKYLKNKCPLIARDMP
ncbi:hypothetical protein DVA43_02430 [Leclercia sp. W6]|uniref:hypothetical protein n=1 Tax=Leclercia sp. W6 TaxID=2282310 RepID=UPI000DF28B56|nr:hypothetical protein [Leclercia sp. W6]AXF58491.1 hypothetical protein DVA43_02430 [Leclercia sp. W6]